MIAQKNKGTGINQSLRLYESEMKPMERLFTRKEAAHILGVSPGTLDLARKQGRISFIQYCPNGSVFFTDESLQEYMAKSTRKAISYDKQKLTYRTPRKRS